LPAGSPPAGIARFPDGLQAPNLFFTGIGPDGWLGAQGRTALALPGPSNALHLVGTIPDFSQKIAGGRLKVTVDDKIVLDTPMSSGPFDRMIALPDVDGTRRIGFDMSATDQLPSDGRAVSIRLAAIALEHRGTP
jgi:hypothetical protein